jgi:hypothetical protein
MSDNPNIGGWCGFHRSKFKIIDSVTGLVRSQGDTGRSGYFRRLTHEHVSPKCCWITIRSGCSDECPICHGSEPGCPGGWERREIKLRRYRASVDYVEQQLRQKNAEYEQHLVFYRTFALLHYLRLLTFSSGNPSQVFFSIYYHYQCVTVQRNPSYRIKSVAFQNQLDSTPFLTWKREKRCLVLSPKQKKFLMCLGEITRLLAIRLVPSIQKWGCHARSSIFERFFGKDSICRLTGGLDPNDDTYRNRTAKYYFGE